MLMITKKFFPLPVRQAGAVFGGLLVLMILLSNAVEAKDLVREHRTLDAQVFRSKFKSVVALVHEVKADQSIVFIGKSGKEEVDASDALVISASKADGSMLMDLADLRLNANAYFLVKKPRDDEGNWRAVLIVQPAREPVSTTLPRVHFDAASSSRMENDMTVTIPVRLSKESSQSVRVDYQVSGTASGNGSDYTLSNGQLVFSPGQRFAEISFPMRNDNLDEVNETVVFILSNPVNATLSHSSVHTFTIRDNDQPRAQFSSPASAGSEGTTFVSIPVSLMSASPHEVRVRYRVTGGTASKRGVDYTLSAKTLVFAPGQTSANVTFSVVDDDRDESDETVLITLYDPTHASLGEFPVHTYTISDND